VPEPKRERADSRDSICARDGGPPAGAEPTESPESRSPCSPRISAESRFKKKKEQKKKIDERLRYDKGPPPARDSEQTASPSPAAAARAPAVGGSALFCSEPGVLPVPSSGYNDDGINPRRSAKPGEIGARELLRLSRPRVGFASTKTKHRINKNPYSPHRQNSRPLPAWSESPPDPILL